MSRLVELLRQGREEELWQMCCGFIDLSTEQFMAIQERLLLEQLKLVSKSTLCSRIMQGARPKTVKEFRNSVPLTTYLDYCPELLERREDVLPAKPVLWQHSSGRTGEYGCKWIPLTERYCTHLARILLGIAILSGCKDRTATKLTERPKMVYAVAPRPYTSGTLVYILNQEFPIDSMPPLERAETMSFEDRVREGFQMSLAKGLDGFCGLALALEAAGERFSNHANQADILSFLFQPGTLMRLAKGLLKSRVARRPILPRDLWSVKGIQTGGTDSSVFKGKIKHLWGRYPLDTYTCTEGAVVATQMWDYSDMTFVPNLNFLEFIPEKECMKWQVDHSYNPETLLFDEVQSGELYEVVITNFHGGALLRYRMGDMIRIASLRNDQLGINQPQMAFERRSDDLIDLAGYMRVTEKTIWQAIEKTGIPYIDWAACKIVAEKPALLLYVELKDSNTGSEANIAAAIYEQIKKQDERVQSSSIYNTLENMLGVLPIQVRLLRPGTFAQYTARRRAEGADLAHLKPPHINPSERDLTLLEAEVVTKPKIEPETELVDMPLLDSAVVPLTNHETYVGQPKSCHAFLKIIGTVYADQPCTLYIEQSQDGSNWDYSVSFALSANSGSMYEVTVAAPYCRLKIVNGPRGQTVLRAYMRGRAF